VCSRCGSRAHHFEGRLRQRAALQVDGVRPRQAGARHAEHESRAGRAAQQRDHLGARQRIRGVPICARMPGFT
jgi:hypothetical protein